MHQYLSHTLTNETPRYGNQGPLELKRVRSMCCGDTSNNTELHIAAHLGTHLDAPFHFDRQGATLESYPPEFWRCAHVALLDVKAPSATVLTLEHLQTPLESVPAEADLLLLRTGWEQRRCAGADSEYIFRGPGLGPDVGRWLRTHRQLKMIGFDFISLTSYAHREVGRAAHRAFLASTDEEGHAVESAPILIIEDMKLADLTHTPREVWVAPLRFENSDGAPVTVIAAC